MANLLVKDGNIATKYMKTDGAGTDGSPYVPHHVLDSGTVTVQDGGGSVTVDNAGTFAVQSTSQTGDNVIGRVKVTDGTEVVSVNISNQLEVAVGNTVNVADGASSLTVDTTGTSGLEVIQSTAADLNVTEANSSAIKTSVELIDNAISGSEMQVDVVAALPVGDNNIGNMDIVTLPAGNLGQQAMVASLSTVPANNITDATYIGDVKFGEGLPANSGVDIGDVTVNNASGASAVNIQDGGNAITVDGTVAVSSGSITVTNTITETNSGAIKTSVETIDNAISGNEILIAGGATQSNDVKVTLDNESVVISSGSINVTNTVAVQDGGNAISVDDNGSSLTVDGTIAVSSGSIAVTNTVAISGTVTANLSSTDNTVLDNIDSNTDYGIVVGGGVEATALRVTIASDSTGVVSVDDNGSSLTVDGTVAVSSGSVNVVSVPAPLSVIGTGTEATALRVTIASDSTGVVSIDDNGGSLTIDGAVSVSSGSITINNANGASAVNIQDGGNTISVDDGASTLSIDDGASSITIDGSITVSSGSINLLANNGVDIGNVDIASVPVPLNIVGGGAEATALRVTLANDSTGVMSVDDNGSSLTIDGAIVVSSGSVNVTNTVAVSGTITVQDGGGVISVDDNSSSLTVDGAVTVSSGSISVTNTVTIQDGGNVISIDDGSGNLSVDWNGTIPPIGAGTEGTALRVTVATDSTGVVSVDDNGSSLTVDGSVSVSSGSVAVTSIATGSNIIGKVVIDQTTPGTTNKVDASGAVPVVTNATGTSAIAISYAPAAAFWLESITLHLSSSGSTSENFTITLNANDGAAYDTVLYSLDLSLGSVTDLVYTPDDSPLLCEAGDAIDIAWPNSGSRTYGLRIVTRLA